MRFTAQEEYGLRCMVQLARADSNGGLTIPQMAGLESLTPAYVGKLLRVLRQAGLVNSTRGQAGGYTLARAPEDITISDVLGALDGDFYSTRLCRRFTGTRKTCVNRKECSVRAVWKTVNEMLEILLARCSLADLLCSECAVEGRLKEHVEQAVS